MVMGCASVMVIYASILPLADGVLPFPIVSPHSPWFRSPRISISVLSVSDILFIFRTKAIHSLHFTLFRL